MKQNMSYLKTGLGCPDESPAETNEHPHVNMDPSSDSTKQQNFSAI